MDEGGQRHEPPDCVRYKPNGGSDDGGGGSGHHRRVENHISGLTRFHISILKANRKQKEKIDFSSCYKMSGPLFSSPSSCNGPW